MSWPELRVVFAVVILFLSFFLPLWFVFLLFRLRDSLLFPLFRIQDSVFFSPTFFLFPAFKVFLFFYFFSAFAFPFSRFHVPSLLLLSFSSVLKFLPFSSFLPSNTYLVDVCFWSRLGPSCFLRSFPFSLSRFLPSLSVKKFYPGISWISSLHRHSHDSATVFNPLFKKPHATQPHCFTHWPALKLSRAKICGGQNNKQRLSWQKPPRWSHPRPSCWWDPQPTNVTGGERRMNIAREEEKKFRRNSGPFESMMEKKW